MAYVRMYEIPGSVLSSGCGCVRIPSNARILGIVTHDNKPYLSVTERSAKDGDITHDVFLCVVAPEREFERRGMSFVGVCSISNVPFHVFTTNRTKSIRKNLVCMNAEENLVKLWERYVNPTTN